MLILPRVAWDNMDDTVKMDTGFEGYPNDYVTHNLPLIVLSGLCESPPPDATTRFPPVYEAPGTEIESELPLVADKRAELLLGEFRSCEKSDEEWSSKPIQGKSTLLGFKFRAVGRVGQEPVCTYSRAIELNKHRTLHFHLTRHFPLQKLME